MNNFVVSKPTADFLARLRVLITLPFGSTTVTFKNHSARAVPYRTALAIGGSSISYPYRRVVAINLLPEQPVPIIPPIVYS